MPKNKKDSNKKSGISNPNTIGKSENLDAIRKLDQIFQIHIVVKPNAKQSLIYWDVDQLRADIQSPPDKSKANQELIKLLAKILGIPSSQIQLIAGHTSRDKILNISGLNKQLEEVRSIIGNRK